MHAGLNKEGEGEKRLEKCGSGTSDGCTELVLRNDEERDEEDMECENGVGDCGKKSGRKRFRIGIREGRLGYLRAVAIWWH